MGAKDLGTRLDQLATYPSSPCEVCCNIFNGSLQSLNWTGGLDWWTGLKIIFMPANENSPVERHSHFFTDSSKSV